MVLNGRGRSHIRAPDRRSRPTGPAHDRRDPFEGAPDSFQSAQRGDVSRRIGRTKGGLNSNLHAVCDGLGRPIILPLTEGQMRDHNGGAIIFPVLPQADTLDGTVSTSVETLI